MGSTLFLLCFISLVLCDIHPSTKAAALELVYDTELWPCPGLDLLTCLATWNPCITRSTWLFCLKPGDSFQNFSSEQNLFLLAKGLDLSVVKVPAFPCPPPLTPQLCSLIFTFDYAAIAITSANLTGKVLPEKLASAPGLLVVLIRYCELQGTVPQLWNTTLTLPQALGPPLGGLTLDFLPSSLFYMDLSSNMLTGPLPTFKNTPFLIALRLALNQLSGTVPDAFVQEAHNLALLDLSVNFFSGTIPVVPDTGLKVKYVLNLNGNQFSGQVPHIPAQAMFLRNNRFDSIDDFFNNPKIHTETKYMDMAVNNVTSLPPSFWNASTYPILELASLQSNRITGTIPSQVRVFQYTDLSFNFMEGEINIESTSANIITVLILDYNRLNASKIEFRPSDMIVLTASQDVNECDLKIDKCDPASTSCTDGWKPLNSYTCTCLLEGLIQINQTHCIDIDECSKDSNPCPGRCINTFGSYFCCPEGFKSESGKCKDINECVQTDGKFLHNCPTNEQCVNTNGSFVCCPSGFFNDNPGQTADLTVCQDINECSRGDVCKARYQCENRVGSYACCQDSFYYSSTELACTACLDEKNWQLTSIPYVETRFPSLKQYSSAFDYKSCAGSCDAGFAAFSQSSSNCPGFEKTVTEPCFFACSNLTGISEASGVLFTIQREFNKRFSSKNNQTFLNNVLSFWNVTASFGSPKRAATSSTTVISLSSCPQQVVSVISGLINDIVPSAQGLTYKIGTNCLLNVTATNPVAQEQQNLIPIIVGAVIGIFVLCVVVIVGIYLYFKYKSRLDWSVLPNEITWSYRQYEKSPREWEFRGSKHNSFYYRELPPSSKEFSRVKELYDLLEGKPLALKGITAVYNPILITNFIGAVKIMNDRLSSSSGLFGRQEWRSTSDALEMTAREKCYAHFLSRVKLFPWNDDARLVPIVAMFHGTELATAEKIAETGFANLSSVDEGYFGKGIYFTTYAIYTIPYLGSKNPVILLSWGIPGNVYPVIEHHAKAGSLLGSALKSGHNSHYVRASCDGTPYQGDSKPGEVFDELVIAQESQIAPAFMLHVDPSSKKTVQKAWMRQVRDTSEKDRARAALLNSQPDDHSMSASYASNVSLEDQSMMF